MDTMPTNTLMCDPPVGSQCCYKRATRCFPPAATRIRSDFEECVRLGMVRDERSLRDYLLEHVVPMLAAFELPYLRFARCAAASNG